MSSKVGHGPPCLRRGWRDRTRSYSATARRPPSPPASSSRMARRGFVSGPPSCSLANRGGTTRSSHQSQDRLHYARQEPETTTTAPLEETVRAVSPRYRIQAIERAVAILNVFSADEPELGVTEIAERVGLHKSTVHRFMVNLDAAGLVERNPRSGRYRLGLHIFELGGLVMQRMNLWDEALPVPGGPRARHRRDRPPGRARRGRGDLHRARRGAPAAAGALGDRPRLPGPRHQPRQGAAGRPPARARRGDRRHARPRGLHAATRSPSSASSRPSSSASARRGYAIDDEEYDEGLRCIGAGVRDHSGRVVSALGIGGPVTRITPERVEELAAWS